MPTTIFTLCSVLVIIIISTFTIISQLWLWSWLQIEATMGPQFPRSQDLGAQKMMASLGPGLRDGSTPSLAGEQKRDPPTAGSPWRGSVVAHLHQTRARTLELNRCSFKPWLSLSSPWPWVSYFLNLSFLISKWREEHFPRGHSWTPGPAPCSVKAGPSPPFPTLLTLQFGATEAVESFGFREQTLISLHFVPQDEKLQVRVNLTKWGAV